MLDPKTDVGVSGNMGWESGTYKATVKGAVVESGKFLSVSRKKGGKWLYVRDTWNARQRMPPSREQTVPTRGATGSRIVSLASVSLPP